jgi:hypothetical protein
MKLWKLFANDLQLTEDLEQVYFEIRKIFQREGWTQKDIERPPYYPNDLMFLHSKFNQLVRETDRTIRDYGFDVDEREVSNYIIDKLSHIDDITPLRTEDGNNQ